MKNKLRNLNTAKNHMRILLLPIALALVTLTLPRLARADAVADWNLIASNAIVVTAGQPPPVSVLHFAMVHGAVYDAVNAIDRGHRPYLVQPASNPTDSKEAAAATAAFRVLVGFDDLPGPFRNQLPTLQPQYDNYIAALPDNPPGSRAAGVTIGEATARAMLTARLNDGRFGPPPTLYPPAPGVWRPTPPSNALDPAPWVGNVRPFLVPSAEMLRTDGPNALTSAEYAEDFNELKELGSLTSKTRTPDQTDAAIFWQDQAMALWNRIFRTLATNQNLAIVDSARFFAMENLAAADALIGCWNDKYYWQFWRPITAIREADTDGNPATAGRPDVAAAVRPSDPGLPPAAARHAAISRPPLGPRLRDRRVRAHAPELLRYRQDCLQRVQQQILYHAELRAILGRAQGGCRRSSMGRHSLSHRRRAGSGARQQGRPLPRKALLPAGPMTPTTDIISKPIRKSKRPTTTQPH